MKRQKLLRNLNSKGRYLPLLLTLTAGLLFSSSAWAWEYAETMDGGLNVRLWVDGGTEVWAFGTGGNKEGQAVKDLGTKNSVVLDGFWTKMRIWTNSGAEHHPRVDGSKMYYALSSDFKTGNGDYYQANTSTDIYTDNKIVNASVQGLGLKTYNTPGDYTLYTYFCIKGKGNDTGDDDCAFMYSNGGSNYQIKFTISGFNKSTADDVNLGEVDINGSGKVSDKIEFHHYGEQPTKAQCSFNGTGKEYYSIESIDYSGVKVKYKPTAGGQHNVTLTITDKYNTSHSTFTVNLKGSGVTAYTPTVLIGAKETVLDTEVTLNGYIKYTGCKNVTEYGFVYGTGETPTTSDNKEVAGTTGAEAGYSYSTTFDEMDNGTYNYRAYMIAGGTTYYSTEVRQFTIESTCPYYPSPKPVLTLNGYVDNVICLDESVVAKCVSKPGFKYALYGPDGNIIGVERDGDGSTLVWQRDNALKAAGTYIIKTQDATHTECWATSAKATQTINSATMTIEAEDSNPYIYEPVTIIKSENQDEFTKPTWSIVTAESGAYLLNFENKLIYSNKEVDKVLFKGGSAKEVQVTANAYKTVVFEGGNKTCPAVVTPVTITVKADDEVCD